MLKPIFKKWCINFIKFKLSWGVSCIIQSQFHNFWWWIHSYVDAPCITIWLSSMLLRDCYTIWSVLFWMAVLNVGNVLNYLIMYFTEFFIASKLPYPTISSGLELFPYAFPFQALLLKILSPPFVWVWLRFQLSILSSMHCIEPSGR